MSRKSRKFDYFDAFERQASFAVEEAKLLINTIETFSADMDIEAVLDEAHRIEHEGDVICHDSYTAIATDFITPIEREDIIEMAQSLDDILDYIEDVVQQFYMFDIKEMHKDALGFAKIIKKSCYAIHDAMDDFRNFKTSKNFKQRLIEINSLEEEADVLYIEIIRKLHQEDKDKPLYVYVWSQIFARMERCTDACEHTADIMRTIMLKNA